MELLNAFTTDELVAITLVMLQLILFAIMLGDKCLWRINDNSKHPSAVRGRPDGRRNVRRTRRSAGMELPRCRSPRCSVSFRKHFPRFIRTSQDSEALFEEHRKELEVQLTQWRCGRGSGRVVHADPPVTPKLLGARQPPQCLGVEVPRPDMNKDMNKATEEDTPKNIRRCSDDSYLTLERRRSMALARLLPRLVVIMNPAILESSSSSSSWSSSSEELEDSSGTAAGRFLGQLRARLQRYLEAWQTYRVQHRRCFRIRFKSQWWRRCWTQLRKRV